MPAFDPSTNWEARQKHTAFYQGLLGSPQQAAIASNATAAVTLTVGLACLKLPGVEAGQGWGILYITVAGWALLSFMLTHGFAKSAGRIRADYRAEHKELFPDASPYRLESFLLDIVDKNPFLFRGEPAARDAPAIGMSGPETVTA